MKVRLLLTGLFIAMVFTGLEHTIIATAMPDIITDLNGIEIFTWATTIYTLCGIIVLPIVGKLSDIFDKRKLYLTGILIFIIGSILCGLAQNMTQLIIFRGIQGIGTGIISPLTQIVIGYVFSPRERVKIQGFFSIIYGASSVLGPIIGGFLVEYISWRWIFYITIPFSLLASLFIFIGLGNQSKSSEGKKKVDTLGSFIISLFLLTFLYGISFGGNSFEWLSIQSLLIFSLSSLLIVLFVFVENRVENPIIDFKLFSNKFLISTNVIVFISGFSKFTAITFVPLFMQVAFQVNAIKAGSVLTPLLLSMIITNYVGAKLLLHMQYRTVAIIGLLFDLLGYLCLSAFGLFPHYSFVFTSMLFLGTGIGMIGAPLTIVAQNKFNKDVVGVVTSTITLFRWTGGIVGITLMNILLNITIVLNFNKSNISENNAIEPSTLYQKLQNTNIVENSEFILLKNIWIDSMHYVFFFNFLLLIVGILVSMFLGKGKIEDEKKSGD